LVIGQAVVQAGLISPIMVIIISLTAIASFAIPSYSLSLASRVLRVIFMILAAVLGSFGIGFMEPLTPYRFKDWKDSIIVLPKSLLKGRPEYLHSSSAVTKRKGCSKNGKVQIMPIVSSTMMGVSILTIQRSLSSIAKGDAWISMILGVILGVFSDLAEIIVCQAGNWVGRLFSTTIYILIDIGLSLKVFLKK